MHGVAVYILRNWLCFDISPSFLELEYYHRKGFVPLIITRPDISVMIIFLNIKATVLLANKPTIDVATMYHVYNSMYYIFVINISLYISATIMLSVSVNYSQKSSSSVQCSPYSTVLRIPPDGIH